MVEVPDRVSALEAEAAFVVLARAQQLAAQGMDVINLGIGQPDFSPPQHVIEAAAKALRDGHHGYTAAPGRIETRQAVSSYLHQQYGLDISPTRVLITPGGKVTMSYAMLLLARPGAEILIPDPGFPTYGVMAKFAGFKVKTYELNASCDFGINADDIASRLTKDTRMLVLNAPGNPTGGTNDWQQVRKLAQILDRYPNCVVLSDEIYSRLCFDAAFTSMATLEPLQDRLIVLDGWSKTYAMTGWRLGWSVWPGGLIEHATNLAIHIHSCVNASAQIAGAAALLGDQSSVDQMRQQFLDRRGFVHERLNAIPGVRCAMPRGAFYAFPDVSGLGVSGAQAQTELLETHGVATIAGTSFGERATGNLRVSFAASAEELQRALSRIADWAKAKRAAQ